MAAARSPDSIAAHLALSRDLQLSAFFFQYAGRLHRATYIPMSTRIYRIASTHDAHMEQAHPCVLSASLILGRWHSAKFWCAHSSPNKQLIIVFICQALSLSWSARRARHVTSSELVIARVTAVYRGIDFYRSHRSKLCVHSQASEVVLADSSWSARTYRGLRGPTKGQCLFSLYTAATNESSLLGPRCAPFSWEGSPQMPTDLP